MQDVCPSICPFVHLSVCLSVTRQYCVEIAEHVVRLSSLSQSQTILFFYTKWYGNIPMGTPQWGHRMQDGYEKIVIFDQYLTLSQK